MPGDSVILVEGAGGLLVDLGGGGTLADIAAELADLDPAAGLAVIVVVRTGLGTLNHTALTCEAPRTRGLPVSGIVLGSWPGNPTPVEVDNRRRLGEYGPVIGAVSDGAGTLDPEAFAAAAPADGVRLTNPGRSNAVTGQPTPRPLHSGVERSTSAMRSAISFGNSTARSAFWSTWRARISSVATTRSSTSIS